MLRGSNKASALKTVYSKSPIISPEMLEPPSPSISIKELARYAAQRQVYKMFCTPVYGNDEISARDNVAI